MSREFKIDLLKRLKSGQIKLNEFVRLTRPNKNELDMSLFNETHLPSLIEAREKIRAERGPEYTSNFIEDIDKIILHLKNKYGQAAKS